MRRSSWRRFRSNLRRTLGGGNHARLSRRRFHAGTLPRKSPGKSAHLTEYHKEEPGFLGSSLFFIAPFTPFAARRRDSTATLPVLTVVISRRASAGGEAERVSAKPRMPPPTNAPARISAREKSQMSALILTECQGVILNLSKKFIPREESSEMKSSSEVCQPSSFLGSWFM